VGGKQRQRWNHNIHYHRLVLDAVPVDARSALDVGTGNGLLAADLCRKVPEVIAIDVDDEVLEAAHEEVDDVEWILGDVMKYPFDRTFDVVASVATLHHLPDLRSALRRFAELTSPGGVLVVVGLARSTRPWEFAVGVAVMASRLLGAHRADRVASTSLVFGSARVCGRGASRYAMETAADVPLRVDLEQAWFPINRANLGPWPAGDRIEL
jgi:2-polyprenyl-3-methyl-5-hydroxy-6-metoxy-1,4-benzoquinol methylase